MRLLLQADGWHEAQPELQVPHAHTARLIQDITALLWQRIHNLLLHSVLTTSPEGIHGSSLLPSLSAFPFLFFFFFWLFFWNHFHHILIIY